MNTQRYSQQGFTLFEIIIVLSIVAIMTAIALPAYQKFVTQGYRSQTQSAMLQIASMLDDDYMRTGNYSEVFIESLNNDHTITQIPNDRPRYTILVKQSDNGSGFIIQARALNHADSCQQFSLNQSLIQKGDKTCWN